MFPTSDPVVAHLSIMKKKWKYRGEGNANLVLALPEERVILRLHKTRRDTPITKDLEYEEMNRVCREAFFCRSVMVPLLGKAYIQPPIVARVQHKEIQHIDQLLQPQRPNFRHHKGISFGYVNIYPDYALLPERLTQIPESLSVPRTTVVCSSRGKCARLRHVSITQDLSLEDVSRVPTTVASVLHQKCVNKNCVLSDPVLLSSDLCQMPSVNRKISKSFLHQYKGSPPAAEPTFCVEIKPKQGWIPRTQPHHPKCTFCLNQYLKLHNGAISRISQYCPLDLFSGDEKRMKKAIKSLLRTPQNNLKIFKDGLLVYSEESCEDLIDVLRQWLDPSSSTSNSQSQSTLDSQRLIDSFCNLVYNTLTTDLLGPDEPTRREDQFFPLICPPLSPCAGEVGLPTLQPCDPSAKPLPSNCILDRILWIQKLQQYDTDAVHHMLWSYQGCEDYDYVTKLRDRDSNRLCLDAIQRYLLATTAKDCSILIAFQHLRNSRSVPPHHVAVEPSYGAQFVFNIGVSDLDPKPLSCIEKHRKRDADILEACSLHPCSPSPPSHHTSSY